MTAAGALVAACTPAVPATPTAPPRPTQSPLPSPTAGSTPTPAPTPSPTAPALSLRQRVARLLLVGYQGTVFDPKGEMAKAVRDLGIGGVLLFGRNIKSPAQLLALTTALHEAAGDRPLLIAVDQEGGKVARLGPANGFPATPSAAEVGALDDWLRLFLATPGDSAQLRERGIAATRQLAKRQLTWLRGMRVDAIECFASDAAEVAAARVACGLAASGA